MDQDAQHLRLLSIFHYVVAGLTFLFGCLPILHVAIGAAMLFRPDIFADGRQAPPPALFGGIFLGIGLAIMLGMWLFAGLMAAAGRCLAQRRHHLFCLVVAAVECLIPPYGTVLGVFTIIVLSRPAVLALFTAPARA